MTTNTTAWRSFGLCAGSRTCKFLDIDDMVESQAKIFDNCLLQSLLLTKAGGGCLIMARCNQPPVYIPLSDVIKLKSSI